jgi:hypothetical protein
VRRAPSSGNEGRFFARTETYPRPPDLSHNPLVRPRGDVSGGVRERGADAVSQVLAAGGNVCREAGSGRTPVTPTGGRGRYLVVRRRPAVQLRPSSTEKSQ